MMGMLVTGVAMVCGLMFYVVDMGPKAGRLGGEVVFQGTPKQMLQTGTLTSCLLYTSRCV